jgi:hypothetical protein
MVDQNAAGRLHAAGLRAHPIWIAPDWVLEAVGKPKLDATAWVGSAAASDIGSLLLVTKQHDGVCIWPSALDSPRSDGDFLGAVCREATQAGVKVFAYYSMAIDDYQVRREPSWAFVDRDGNGCEAIGFRWACLNSPYGDFVQTQIEEILSGYAVDALWLDIFALGPRDRDCVCEWCRRRYKAIHGGDLLSLSDPEAFGRWKVECLEDQLGRLSVLRDRYRPDALIAFNGAGAGFRRHPEAGLASLSLFDKVDFLSDEGHDVRFESAMAKAMRAHGRPFEVLTSDGIANEWAGWVTKPSGLLSLEGCVVGSHGGSFGLGISILPNGEVPDAELSVVAVAGSFLAERRPWFVPQAAVSDIQVLIQTLRSTEAFVPPERPAAAPRLPRDGAHHVPEVYDPEPIANGWWDALRENHIPFDFIHEHRGIDEATVVILQANARLTDEVCDRIRSFVQRGGVLIAEGHASLVDGHGGRRADYGLADVLGVHFRGYTGAWDANYIRLDVTELRHGLPGYPLLIAGPALEVDVDGASTLASVIPPIGGEQRIDHHTASLFNPPGTIATSPAITHHQYGKGRALYLTQALGDHIRSRRDVDPWTKRLAANIAGLAAGEPSLRTDAPPGVEVVMNRAPEGGLWIHLLNHYGAHSALGVDVGPDIAPIRIDINEAKVGRVETIVAAPPAQPLSIDRTKDGWATIVAPRFGVHQVLDVALTRE